MRLFHVFRSISLRSGWLPGATVMWAGINLAAVPTVWAENAVTVGVQGQAIAFVNTDLTQGWRFNIDVPISITALGLLDANNDGFQAPHPIAIWDSAGEMKAHAVVQAGTVNPLVNRFRYATIDAGDEVILYPGEEYTIGYFHPAWATQDTFVIWNGTHTTHPVINQASNCVSHLGSTLTMPVEESLGQCFGPSFQFEIVPGPGAAMSLLLGGAIIAPRRRRGRQV